MLLVVLADGVTKVLSEGLASVRISWPFSANGEWGLSGGGVPWEGFPPPSRMGRTLNPRGTSSSSSKRWSLAVVGRREGLSTPGCFVSFGESLPYRGWGSEVVPSFVCGSLHLSVEGPSDPHVPPAEVRFATPGTYRRRSLGPPDRACLPLRAAGGVDLPSVGPRSEGCV